MRSLRLLLAAGLFACPLVLGACSESQPADYALTIFHQNDRHSHWLGQPNLAYTGAIGDGTVGGMGRWMKLYADDPAPNKLLLDAGDFKMGTLFGAAGDAGGDLDLLAELGFTAAALGNHELDWGPAGLVGMIQASQAPGVPLLCANIHFSASDPADDALEALYGPEGAAGKRIHPYILREVGGVRVGILGLIGPTAYGTVAYQAAPLTFATNIDALVPEVQAVVDEMRDEGADVVILLAHMGISIQAGQPTGDTIELLRRVRGVDLALSGHEHTLSPELHAIAGPDGETAWTLEAGSYGRYLSRVELGRVGGVRSASGQILTIDDSLAADPTLGAKVEPLVQSVEQDLLQGFPVLPDAGAFLSGEFEQTLTTSAFPLERVYFDAHNLAYLAADAARQASGSPVAALSNGGDVRDGLQLGPGGAIGLPDAFIVTPLGIGPDGRLGYPLVEFYLSWASLKLILEATSASAGLENNDYFMITSGLRMELDSSAPQYMRIRKLTTYTSLDESDAGTVVYDASRNPDWAFDPMTELVQLTTTSYIAAFLASFNLQPLDPSGQPAAPALVTDAAGHEVKLWYAVAGYLASMTGGVPEQYNPDAAQNPIGPAWRRVWDLARHPR